MRKKLTTKIEYTFNDQENFPEFNIDMKIKTRKKHKSIKIIKHKKKVIDPSTKLF